MRGLGGDPVGEPADVREVVGAGFGQHRHPQLTEPVDGGQVELAHLDGAEGQFGGECPAVHLSANRISSGRAIANS